MADDDEGTPPPPHGGGRSGGGLTRKIGPLPVWLWAVGVGALGGVVWFWRRSKGAAADSTSADSTAAGSEETTPASLVPINQGLSEDQTQSILDAIKKLQGAPSDDDDDDDDDDKPKPSPAPKPKPKPKPPTPGKPGDPSHHPKTVTVVKWTKHNTPWNSTLWGIAHHEHVKGGWQYLQKINHLHGDPKKALKPGMKIKLSA